MLPQTEDKPPQALSPRKILLLILSGIAFAFLLIPSQKELREGILRERLCASITPVLAVDRFRDGRTSIEALKSLTTERLQALSTLATLDPRQQLKSILGGPGKLKYDEFSHCFVIAGIRYVEPISASEAVDLVLPRSLEMPDSMRLEAYEIMAQNAISSNLPAMASELLRQSCRSTESTWTTVEEMVRASRWAGRQAEAMETFRHWMLREGNELSPEEKKAAREMQFSLALEANLPGEALEACIQEFNRLPSITPASADLMERTHRAAVLSERSKEILPWVESFLSTFAEASWTCPQLIAEAKQPKTQTTEYKKWLKRAAEIADWNLLPEKAYAHIQRLLSAGDLSLLDRFLPLSNYLGRGEDTALVLQSLDGLISKQQLHIQTARLIASNGKPEEALAMFEEWVDENPEDLAAAYELACLKEATADTATAIAAFERFLRNFPTHAPGIKMLAALRIRNGQTEGALRELDSLSPADFDSDTLENYTMLAESLDRPTSLQRALQIISTRPREATPELYLRMSEVARQENDDEKPLSILREGIKKMPQSPSLRIELATLLLDQESFDSALAELLHPVTQNRLDAQILALSAAVHTLRCEDVLDIVGADFEKRQPLPESTRLDLAVACILAGDLTRGEKLFASVPMEQINYSRIGTARLLAGHFEEAERLAKLNISQNTKPSASDWILLGDAISRQGRDPEANDAYSKALAVVSQNLNQRNKGTPVASGNSTPNNR